MQPLLSPQVSSSGIKSYSESRVPSGFPRTIRAIVSVWVRSLLVHGPRHGFVDPPAWGI